MDRIFEERRKLTSAIDANTYRDQHVALYAARQALSWAINPESAASPYDMIMGNDLITPRRPTAAPLEAILADEDLDDLETM
jgi:hypothetical protein